ncbi:hypothetical protein O181_057148 [Austropuccinia psidii MF-1]|uniref:Uncharacterized protein n=1 Tax=Austropuccinia psidii MF-1 TaxID=1389203 RepID=A0A9Q3HU71_9BASI|nr:hypothetical protein [Austropuccinia psidii MF-1]
MPVQHSPPARQKISQPRTHNFLTSTPREPLDVTPEVPQLTALLDRGPTMEGDAPGRKEARGPIKSISFSVFIGSLPGMSNTSFKGLNEDGEEEEENSGTGGPTIA